MLKALAVFTMFRGRPVRHGRLLEFLDRVQLHAVHAGQHSLLEPATNPKNFSLPDDSGSLFLPMIRSLQHHACSKYCQPRTTRAPSLGFATLQNTSSRLMLGSGGSQSDMAHLLTASGVSGVNRMKNL